MKVNEKVGSIMKGQGFDVLRINSKNLQAARDGVSYRALLRHRVFTPGESLQEGFSIKDKKKLQKLAKKHGDTPMVVFIGSYKKGEKLITIYNFIELPDVILLPKRTGGKDPNYIFYFNNRNSRFERLVSDGTIYRVMEEGSL
jgi:ABC-type antimicrobial peptide transport system permease subunit